MFSGLQWAVQQGARVVSISIELDFPNFVKKQIDGGTPADVATSHALEAYRANLRMFDALMQMNRSLEPFGNGAVVVGAAGNGSHRDVNPDFEVSVELPAATDASCPSLPWRSPRAVFRSPHSPTRSPRLAGRGWTSCRPS